jgi:hypothetical protein
MRATRRAQDRRSPLTVKRTRARAVPTPQRAIAAGGVGSRRGLRGTGARNGPAKVAHSPVILLPHHNSYSQSDGNVGDGALPGGRAGIGENKVWLRWT